MKNYTITLLMFLIVLAFGENQVKAQSTLQTADTFNKLGDCINRAEGKYAEMQSAKKVLRDIRKSFDFISNKWLGAEAKKELPPDYLKTLGINCELLAQAVQATDQAEAVGKLKSVKRDLQFKEKAARKGLNAAENLNASINVTVRTFRDDKEVSGYSIGCNPQLYADNDPSLFPFNSDTSPSIRSLPPGYYILWIKKNGQKITSREISIGDQDSSDTDIKISLP